MPNPGQPFTTGDDVTAERLNALVSGQTFIAGEIPGAALADSGVARAKLAADAVDNSKVQKNSLNPDRLVAAATVNSTKVGQVHVSQTNGDFAAKVLSGAVTVNADGVASLGDNAVTAAKLADNSVESRAIKSGAVLTNHLNTLVVESSNTANNYAVTLSGVTLFRGLELKLLVVNANTGPLTLVFNGEPPAQVVKPGGGQFAAREISGGSILSLVWTGSAWLMLSPWVQLSWQTHTSSSGGVTNPLPVDLLKVRIRVWGAGGNAAQFGNLTRAGGGGGAFAEWQGTKEQGNFVSGDTLLVSNGASHMVVSRNNANSYGSNNSQVLLKCGHGGAGSVYGYPNGSGGVGGQYVSGESWLNAVGDGVRSAAGRNGAFDPYQQLTSVAGEGSNGRGRGGDMLLPAPFTSRAPDSALVIVETLVQA